MCFCFCLVVSIQFSTCGALCKPVVACVVPKKSLFEVFYSSLSTIMQISALHMASQQTQKF